MTRGEQVLETGPVLLYDGGCGVCSESVQWILGHERQQGLRFLPLEAPLGGELRELAGIDAALDSVLWVELRNGVVHADVRSEALLRVLAYVGGPWGLLTVLRFVPRFIRDVGYRAFAKIRYRIRDRSCLVPTLEQRRRFLEG
ncbi:MAG: DCC1-like thiol-disulfide oxidoreductase family protein [Polyangiaceae bacterium]